MADIMQADSVTAEHIPVYFTAPKFIDMASMFDGPLPLVGDIVDLVCYEIGNNDGMEFIKCKWRVRNHG